jgi:hypothetical protein
MPLTHVFGVVNVLANRAAIGVMKFFRGLLRYMGAMTMLVH